MRVTVIGASGGIGREFVRQAIAADHEVTAVIRDSARSGAACGSGNGCRSAAPDGCMSRSSTHSRPGSWSGR